MYLRKSFRAGPLRFNLSKGGVGLSLGVKGARVGVTPSGRAYTHVGRYGVYDRRFFGTGSTDRPDAVASPGGAVELFVDTDATFDRPAFREAETSEEALAWLGTLPKPPAEGWLLAAAAVAAASFFVAPSLALLAIVPGAVSAFAFRRRAAARRLEELIPRCVGEPSPEMTKRRGEVETLVGSGVLRAADCSTLGKRALIGFVADAVLDGRIDPPESERIEWIAQTFRLDEHARLRACVHGFQQAFLCAIEDGVLDPEEEAGLRQIQRTLGIPDRAVEAELAVVSELGAVRRILDSPDLSPVETQVKLQRGESCYFEGPARILKSRILRRYSRDGVKHRIRGFEVAKEGTLLVTSTRLSVVHEGVTNIPYRKVMDLELDLDRNLISIRKDGVQTPTLLTTPDAPRVAALVSRLADV